MFAPVYQTHYFDAVQNLRSLVGLSNITRSDFDQRAGALVASLEHLGFTPKQLEELRQLNTSTAASAQDGEIAKPFLQHYFKDLKRAGLYPQSHHEPNEDTLRRLQALIDGRSSLFAPHGSSRRETNLADEGVPSKRMQQILLQAREALNQQKPPAVALQAPQPVQETRAAAPSDRPSPTPASVNGRQRLIIREHVYGSDREENIESQYELYPLPLGEGGFGKVYSGRDTDTGLKVAIKIITDEKADRDQFLERFKNEREYQGSIDDDHVVKIYKAGLTKDGSPYLVMELLTGGTLMSLIEEIHRRERPFNLKEVKHAGAMAIASVCAAHRHGILHKDIKPENLLFDELRRKLKLGDFGISERIDQATPNGHGTLGYMPPEALTGAAPTPQQDVFALGVLLYLLYTGHMPFHDTNVGVNLHDMMTRIPINPSQLRKDRQIPEEESRIILKALATNPADRYATAEDLLYEFVTSDVRVLMEKINDLREIISANPNDPDNLQRIRLWKQMMREAIRKLEHLEERYPSDRIRSTRLGLLETLHDHANIVGNESLLRETAETIAMIDPANTRLEDIASTVSLRLAFDDPHHLLKRIRPEFAIASFEDRAGVMQMTSVERMPLVGRVMENPRGSLQGLVVRGEGLYPVFIPFPVRPGSHHVRIPIYSHDEVPENSLLITAGTMPSRNRYGSYSELIQPSDERRVDHDFALGNLVSNHDYWQFLSELQRAGRSAEIERRKPASWTFTDSQILGPDGNPIALNEPVRFVSVEDMKAYLALMRPGARFPTMNEQKRAGRGNDARCFPWGDAPAYKPGMSAYQFVGFEPSLNPMPSVPDDPFFGDRSPFSVPSADGRGFERAAYHLAGNLREVLTLGVTPEERAPILGAFSATRHFNPADPRLNDQLFVTYGLPFNSPPPTNGDIIGIEATGTQKLAYGFRWVLPLRKVP